MRALVGYTGFIGSNLAKQSSFDHFYNSKNIEEIIGKSYDEIVFSGLPGVKWKANLNPDEDTAVVDLMMKRLQTVKCRKFVYVSTIDVYKNHMDVNERTPVSYDHYPYGSNRSRFESFILKEYKESLAVRLPIVFGEGFKKNYLFDLMNRKNLQNVYIRNKVQFYDVNDLTRDIEETKKISDTIFNFSTQPIELSELVEAYFPDLKDDCTDDWNYSSNMTTKHRASGYMRDKKEMIAKIGQFIK